jgi:cytochrome c553
MKSLVRISGFVFILTLAVCGLSAQSGDQTSPAWAYGVPPFTAGAATSTPAPGQPGQAPAAPRQPDTSLKHVPGSTQEFTLAHIRDYWDVGDWFPDDHPPMPDVVVHGRKPHVRGCAMCHMPNGKGRPENAPVAGQPYAYVVQQLNDFKNDLRSSADTRKTNTVQMIEAAKDMTDDEIKAAATYFSSMKWTPWIRVVETDTVPTTTIRGNVFFATPDGAKEPIGNRIIETPEDGERFELRDPRSGFIAYVPTGSLKKGAAFVASGGNKTLACGTCHGVDLKGLGPVPGLAGRSPSYIMRQLWDFKQGTRKGTWSPLMKQVVDPLTQEDMLSIAAYLSSLGV